MTKLSAPGWVVPAFLPSALTSTPARGVSQGPPCFSLHGVDGDRVTFSHDDDQNGPRSVQGGLDEGMGFAFGGAA